MDDDRFEKALDTLGPTGRNAADAVRRLRTNKHMSYAELSRKLSAVGRPIPTLGLRKIESGSRRIDTDDLVALAITLDVSPATLLTPSTEGISEWRTSQTKITEKVSATPQALWEWLIAAYPLRRTSSDREPSRATLEFRMNARPSEADVMDQLGFSPEGRERRGND